ncbi:MAG: hypothetical protein J6W29_06220 [Neisseriaceae bacterium]|nr:hypothetical protein [Neisseriaceae bacterium]
MTVSFFSGSLKWCCALSLFVVGRLRTHCLMAMLAMTTKGSLLHSKPRTEA